MFLNIFYVCYNIVVVEIQAKFWATWNCKSSPWAFFVVNNDESPKIKVAY